MSGPIGALEAWLGALELGALNALSNVRVCVVSPLAGRVEGLLWGAGQGAVPIESPTGFSAESGAGSVRTCVPTGSPWRLPSLNPLERRAAFGALWESGDIEIPRSAWLCLVESRPDILSSGRGISV